MNIKKIIYLVTVAILITPYEMYSMLRKTGSKFTAGRTYIPLLTTSGSSTLKDFNSSSFNNIANSKLQNDNALIPMTSNIFQANLINQRIASPDIAKSIGLEREITQRIQDFTQLNVRNQNWIDNQLEKVNELYNRFIMSNLNSNQTLLNIYRIQANSKAKLNIFNDIKKKLERNNLNTKKINDYIKETENTILSADLLDTQLFYEPNGIFNAPELKKDLESIKNSPSPIDLLSELNSFLRSAKYQAIKKEYNKQQEKDKASFKDSEARWDDFYNESNYEPYAGLKEQFNKAGKQGALLAGLTTEEYMRRKHSAEQKNKQKIAERNDMHDFNPGI